MSIVLVEISTFPDADPNMDGTYGGLGTVHNRMFAHLGFTLIKPMVTIALLSIQLTLGPHHLTH
jgi:hypothetical protein